MKVSDGTNSADLKAYLESSDVIDWHHPAIRDRAEALASSISTDVDESLGAEVAIAKACFEWVRDEIRHSVDYQMNPVTCRASDVLHHRTGYCYAKSHLLAALLRANGIPAGLCYQRLSVDDTGAPYSLHGLNAVHLPKFGWYRVDPRGNRPGVDAQFTPPKEQLAFRLHLPEEVDLPGIWPKPLDGVVKTLETYDKWDEVLKHLPDISLNGT